MLTVAAKVNAVVPASETDATFSALLAALPGDVKPVAMVSVSFPTPDGTPGFLMTISISGPMSQADLVKFLPAVVAALPADAVIVPGSGSLTF